MDFRNIKKYTFTSVLLSLAVFCAHAETTVTYLINDGLGSPIAAMNEQGAVVWRKDYQPYGSEYSQDPAATGERIGYTGHVHDTSTGLIYMGARYYDPVIGRFMAADPVGFDESNPMSFSRYGYANSNPYRYVDPDGRSATTIAAVDTILIGGLLHYALPGREKREETLLGIWKVFNNDSDEGHEGSTGPIPAPNDLPAFPDAKPAKPKTSVQGGGGKRKRWKDNKGRIFEWDSQHGTVEQYDKTGKKHRGEFDHNSGDQIKPPTKGREVEP